jgi:Fe-S-cluster containining protein
MWPGTGGHNQRGPCCGRKDWYNPRDMTAQPRKRPRCAMCGECCRAPTIMLTKPGDHRRWVRQGRTDILRHAPAPPPRGYGDLRAGATGTEDQAYCPFARRVGHGRFVCAIQDTKPRVCREFRCEWAYGVGSRGIPFKTESGWTDRAVRLGYGRNGNRDAADIGMPTGHPDRR